MANNEPKQSIEAAEEAQAQNAQYRKIFAYCGGAIAIAVVAILVYIFAIRTPGIEKGNNAIAEVDILAVANQNLGDSLIVEAYKNVADQNGFDAANRAAYMAAAGLYRQGNYEEALAYINKFSTSDPLTKALALGLKGDCLVNLDKYDDAISAFSSAAKAADNNIVLVPYYLTKKAVVLAEQGKHAEAADIYNVIEQKYPDYSAATNAPAHKLQQEALAQQK